MALPGEPFAMLTKCHMKKREIELESASLHTREGSVGDLTGCQVLALGLSAIVAIAMYAGCVYPAQTCLLKTECENSLLRIWFR